MFFFFKQKTAYEWRISDWSSDVCSSDLLLYQTEADIVPVARPHLERLSQALQETVFLSRINGRQTQLLDVFVGEQVLRIVPQAGLTAPLHLTADGKALLARMTSAEEIGRAHV